MGVTQAYEAATRLHRNLAERVHRNTRGQRMEFDRWPFLRALYQDQSREIALQSSTQAGKSEYQVTKALAWSLLGASVFYVLPTSSLKDKFVANRVDRALHRKEYRSIRAVINQAVDNRGLKHVGEGVIAFVGSNSVVSFKEFPADVAIVDELDQCEQTNVEMIEDRLGASEIKHKCWAANPTVSSAGIARIIREESDEKRWFIPCPWCGERQTLLWEQNIVKETRDERGHLLTVDLRDKDWSLEADRDILAMCRACDRPLDRLSPGEVVATRKGKFPVSGYVVSKLFSPFNELQQLWRRYQRCRWSLAKLMVFVNSDLGEAFDAGMQALTGELLDLMCADTPFMLFPGVTDYAPCTAGVDVGTFLDVRISDYPPWPKEGHPVTKLKLKKPRRRCVFAGKVATDEELYALFRRFNVRTAVMDAHPEIKRVRDIQRKLKREVDVWRCVYEATEGRQIKDPQLDEETRTVKVDRTTLLDDAFSDFVSGTNWLPKNWRDLAFGEYEEEICGPKRALEVDAKGRERYVWTKCKDHQRHADAYDHLASQLRGTFNPLVGIPQAESYHEARFNPFKGLQPEGAR